jgi:hypothetical protein
MCLCGARVEYVGCYVLFLLRFQLHDRQTLVGLEWEALL